MGRGKAKEAELDTFGQMTIPLDGQDYVVRPSRSAIAAVERQLGKALLQLAGDAIRGTLTIDEIAVICVELMRAYGQANPDDPLAADYRGAKAERIADLVHEAGPPRITNRLSVVLLGALTGGYTASGEPRPAK